MADPAGAGGIRMVVETSEPGLQLIDATGFDSGPHAGHGGARLGNRAGIALEDTHEQITRFRFSRG